MSWANNLVEIVGLAPKTIGSLGLLLDLIGISILFIFQVDRNHSLRQDGSVLFALETNNDLIRKWNLYRRLTIAGFVLLILGFAFQLVGNLAA